MIIKNEDIVGYKIESEDVCAECATDEEANTAKGDAILTLQDIERDPDTLHFCDRCKERIQ